MIMLDLGLIEKEMNATYQHQRAERSYPCVGDGGHDRRGMRDQPWTNG